MHLYLSIINYIRLKIYYKNNVIEIWRFLVYPGLFHISITIFFYDMIRVQDFPGTPSFTKNTTKTRSIYYE